MAATERVSLEFFLIRYPPPGLYYISHHNPFLLRKEYKHLGLKSQNYIPDLSSSD